MPYVGQTITEVFPTSISVDSATIKGDTTIGDASAADKKILFDGNAQDFHIGLDDSTDSLTIGLGSALGTTSHMVIDANGHVTKPLQSCCLVKPNSTISNVSNSSAITMTFDNEIFDVNGDFASNTFTAPVTGKYLINFSLALSNIDTAANYYQAYINTSNRNYFTANYDPDFADADFTLFNMQGSAVCDLDAGDTAKITFQQSAGTAQTDIDTNSFINVTLIC